MAPNFFKPSEWDNDVPELGGAANLTKKFKLRGLKKKDKNSVELTADIDVVSPLKRKHENDNETKNKKKKHNTDSYFKFESPKIDNTLTGDLDFSQRQVPSLTKNKNPKKKTLKVASTLEDINASLKENKKKNKTVETSVFTVADSQLSQKKSKNKKLKQVLQKNDNKESSVIDNAKKEVNENESSSARSKYENNQKKKQKNKEKLQKNVSKNASAIDTQNNKVDENESISAESKNEKQIKKQKNKNAPANDTETLTKDLQNNKDIEELRNKKLLKKLKKKNIAQDVNRVSKNKLKKNKFKLNKQSNEPSAETKTTVLNTSQPTIKSTGSNKPNEIIKSANSTRKSKNYAEKIKMLLEDTEVPVTVDKTKDSLKTDNENILLEMNNKPENKRKSSSKSLRERMLEKIKGARFRYLNEQMYVKQSNEALKIFKQDPDAFKAYHEGYKQQLDKWPLNPLDLIIKDMAKLPKNFIIADMGCGDARLSKSIPHKVYSFDLVALDDSVNACDMSHTPLQTGHVDVVVYCLSLMGTNLKDYLVEANRILKIGGHLKIAEVESRFPNVEEFIGDVKKYGFSLVKKDLSHQLFYFMDFKKESDIKKKNKLPLITLNACLYKKR